MGQIISYDDTVSPVQDSYPPAELAHDFTKLENIFLVKTSKKSNGFCYISVHHYKNIFRNKSEICNNKLLFFIVTGDLNFLKLKPSSEPLITWRTVEKRVPWGIILLLGGGFALAKGCEVSGKPNLITTEKS